MSGAGRMGPRLKVAVISEVSVGYGTPQVLRFAASLAGELGADVHVFEPDQPERVQVDIREHVASPTVSLTRVFASHHPYSKAGRIEFCLHVAKLVKELAPQVIVVCASYGLPVLLRIDAERSLNVFYCLEDIKEQPDPIYDLVRRHCRIVVFPESNRARIYMDRLGGIAAGQDTVVLYNANYDRGAGAVRERMPRFFYGGTFHKEMTLGDHFLDPKVAALPIDVYGIIDGYPNRQAVIDQMSGKNGGIRYCGYLETNAAFFELQGRYQYSLVLWNPNSTPQYYAAPNKLFDAIACGLPVICAPHPQCVEVVSRWNCGLVLDDWSLASFAARLKQAVGTFGTQFHAELAANCARAMAGGLDWPSQFAKLAPLLDKHLARMGAVGRRG